MKTAEIEGLRDIAMATNSGTKIATLAVHGLIPDNYMRFCIKDG